MDYTIQVISPVCTDCNKRRIGADDNYLNWEEHLKQICKEKIQLESFDKRLRLLKDHMTKSEYSYPDLNDSENHPIRVIASTLYENVKKEHEKSLEMFKKLDEAFLKNDN